MPIWKYLMWPIALLWGFGSWIRNKLYDSQFLSSAEFEIPVICIGNLSMGGSGKTPHVEYFLYHFRNMFNLAVLSRGHRRRTTGFRIARPKDNYEVVGDEPRQIKSKFPGVAVAVGESRALAIPSLLAKFPATQIILMDDAYQHRSVLPALNILLTPYSLPFWEDQLFPVGWLRESRRNYKRADIIIVTKCPDNFDSEMEAALKGRFQPDAGQRMFFSKIRYGRPYLLLAGDERRDIDRDTSVVLFSGIANGGDLREYIAGIAHEVTWLEFDDHYNYDQRDLETLAQAFSNVENPNRMILTTEKDAVRLEPFRAFLVQEGLPVYCQPIRVEFTGSNRDEFDNLVLQYLEYYKGAQKDD